MKFKANYLLTLIINISKLIIGSIPGFIILLLFYYFNNVNETFYISVFIMYGFFIAIVLICILIHLIISLFSKPLIVAENYYFIYKDKSIKYADILVIEFNSGELRKHSYDYSILSLSCKNEVFIDIENVPFFFVLLLKKKNKKAILRFIRKNELFIIALMSVVISVVFGIMLIAG